MCWFFEAEFQVWVRSTAHVSADFHYSIFHFSPLLVCEWQQSGAAGRMSDWALRASSSQSLGLASCVEKSRGLDTPQFNQSFSLSFSPAFWVHVMTGLERSKERLSRSAKESQESTDCLLIFGATWGRTYWILTSNFLGPKRTNTILRCLNFFFFISKTKQGCHKWSCCMCSKQNTSQGLKSASVPSEN